MNLLPTHHRQDNILPPERTCWKCQLRYTDNAGDGNPEARCPGCSASQAICERCGDAGAECCIHCEAELCRGCWPRHRDGKTFCEGGGEPPAPLESYNLNDAERRLIVEALERAGSIVHAALLLGTTRHSVKRRIIKHRISWPLPDMQRGGVR